MNIGIVLALFLFISKRFVSNVLAQLTTILLKVQFNELLVYELSDYLCVRSKRWNCVWTSSPKHHFGLLQVTQYNCYIETIHIQSCGNLTSESPRNCGHVCVPIECLTCMFYRGLSDMYGVPWIVCHVFVPMDCLY